MLDLLATLNLGARSLQTQQQGVTVAGRNLGNVNNPAYSRQRLVVQTAPTVPTDFGPQGSGVNASAVVQLRSDLVDRQILRESSVEGFLQARQEALQLTQNELGQVIDRQASTPDGTASTTGVAGQNGLAQGLSGLFEAFQSLSTDPSSISQRQGVLASASQLAAQFNQASQRLQSVQDTLNQSVQNGVAPVNALLSQIAALNGQITRVQGAGDGAANDFLDARQQKLEDLGKLVNFQAGTDSSGQVNISVGGTTLVSNDGVVDTLGTYDAGGGRFLVRAQAAGLPLNLTGGSIQGSIDARDGELASLQSGLNTLAAQLVSTVNSVHASGFSLSGSTGQNFFTGSTAADIQVNGTLLGDPGLLQASATAGAAGDNQVALQLAQLKDQAPAALKGQSFQQSYSQTVTGLGQALAGANGEVADQTLVGNMLQNQRQSVSGVSVDEEMSDLVRYQRAFEASAHLISTVDEMLQTVVNLGQ